MSAFYNENNPFAAQTLRNLIAAGHIAPGVVDERSIEDIKPHELTGYTQCHFFAGIGIWSAALRRAGVGDHVPVWTGSCPCQPFSSAGQGAGFADERHLWPAWHHLIRECRPSVLLGEQVASKDAGPWVDLVQDDLEAMDYAFGAVPFPAAGIGAPHIRDRLYWVADSRSTGLEGFKLGGQRTDVQRSAAERSGDAGILAHPDLSPGEQGRALDGRRDQGSNALAWPRPGSDGVSGELADTNRQRLDGEQVRLQPGQSRREGVEAAGRGGVGGMVDIGWPGPLGGFWRDADWLFCRDGRWRPVEPGTFPLAHVLPRGMGVIDARLRGLAEVAGLDGASLKRAKAYRVGALRGYGNAIVLEQAARFIECVMEPQP